MQHYLRIAIAIGLVAWLAACTSPAPSTVASATPARAMNTCIQTSLIKKQKILSDQDIRFEMSNGEVWMNHLDHRCPGLKSEQSFGWEVHGMSVCSNQQTIHLLEAGTSCQLGEFTRQPPPAT
jgi:FlaG/FlaF family flagellin (archaellin)